MFEANRLALASFWGKFRRLIPVAIAILINHSINVATIRLPRDINTIDNIVPPFCVNVVNILIRHFKCSAVTHINILCPH